VSGGYYLCTQKLLQDQLEKDVQRYPPLLQGAVSLKSAIEYSCPGYKNCARGRIARPRCRLANEMRDCNYMRCKDEFEEAPMAITNYPYFFTERTYLKQFPPRKILICDECHTLESQVLKFIEVVVGEETLQDWAPRLKFVPTMPKIEEFCAWLEEKYLPILQSRLEAYDEENMATGDDKKLKDRMRLESQISKTVSAVAGIKDDPHNWVYWQERDKAEVCNRLQNHWMPHLTFQNCLQTQRPFVFTCQLIQGSGKCSVGA
jgi:Rad3-related DNA helicase